MNRFAIVITIALQCFTLFDETWGHGMLLAPPGRSSRWRYDKKAPVNYDDDGNFCGGLSDYFIASNGKCGLCGDDFRAPTPRANELGGLYGGSGVIVGTYEGGKAAQFGFRLTTNHKGYVYFDLCNLDKFGKESEECFAENRLKFVDGTDKFFVGKRTGWLNSTVVLPDNETCKHCVLRWTYVAGNNWNECGDGTGGMGCGIQETFKSCADVRIK